MTTLLLTTGHMWDELWRLKDERKKKGKRYWWWLYLDGKRIYFCLYLFQRRAPYLSFHTSLCVWGFLLDCSMYFYINKIRESGGKRHVIRLLVPQADVNFACTRHSLSCCLHTKSSLYNKSPKRHPSSARGCIHSSEIPFAIKPCITRIGAVSHVVSLYTKLEFAAFSRVVLRFVSSPVYSLHLSRYWVFWSFSCSIICLPFRIRPLQRWDCLRKWPFAWPFGWTFGILGPDGRWQPTRSWHNRL